MKDANDQVALLDSKILKLQFQLEEEHHKDTLGNHHDTELHKYQTLLSELTDQNSQLRQELHNVSLVENELSDLRMLLAETRAEFIESTKMHSSITAELKNTLMAEQKDKARVQAESTQLLEKIRILQQRRSIVQVEEATPLEEFLSLKHPLRSILQTAFVNGSKSKRLFSCYFVFLHLLLAVLIFRFL